MVINQGNMEQIKAGTAADFTLALMKWNETNLRPMPWKGEKNPYRIWLSEIILQQTRVEQGLPYYENFVSAYPTVQDLAEAPEKEVFRLWQGLGYYTRCRNMIAAARKIRADYDCNFPSDYEEILQLPGIGEYTAAAIASFAFQLPCAVVDGNVQRVLARYFGLEEPVNSTAGKKSFSLLANKVLYKKDPATFNQAIMDFGATVCTPKQPLCRTCPLARNCYAFQHQAVSKLPVKKPKAKSRERCFYYLVPTYKDTLYLHQRNGKDIWDQLYEFPLYEGSPFEKEICLTDVPFVKPFLRNNPAISSKESKIYRQQLTHQRITAAFIHLTLKKPLKKIAGYIIVKRQNLNEFAFPRVIVRYLQDENWVSF